VPLVPVRAPRLPLVLLVSLLAGAGGCESHEQEANELALLLQRVQGYTSADEDEQEAQLEALRRFAPSTKRVKEARQACLEAYSLVERAERDHAEAKRILEAVTSGSADLAKSRPQIQQRIDRSNQAIDDAKPRIRRCTRLLSDLQRDHRR
jgi:chromosome segregation ATPase